MVFPGFFFFISTHFFEALNDTLKLIFFQGFIFTPFQSHPWHVGTDMQLKIFFKVETLFMSYRKGFLVGRGYIGS